MNIIGIIPARMASSRFPGKPLSKINDRPMIEHVFRNASQCKLLRKVFIATCDKEIADFAESIGAEAVMTSIKHERASDRTAEAMLKIEDAEGVQCDIVAMIQGDEPMITASMIDEAVKPLIQDDSVFITNLMEKIHYQDEHEDPNEVKVVVDASSNALYFSREPIPSRKKGAKNFLMLKQVCVIPFRRDFLLKYNKMDPTPLEIIESIDMNRLIENNYNVKMVFVENTTYSVDTEEDRKKVEMLMQEKDKTE